MIFLALVLIGAGAYFYIVGYNVWNETLDKVKQSAGNAGDRLIIYDNLIYAHKRIIAGIYMVGGGMLSLLIAAYRGSYKS